MAVAEKLTTVANNVPRVYAAGYTKGASGGAGHIINAYYNTLEEALAETNSVSVGKIGTYTDNDGVHNIVLLSDITITAEVTIERDCILRLNGYVITEEADGCIFCAANVKIDGSIEQSGIVRNIDTDQPAAYYLLRSNTGTLDIYKGNYIVTATAKTIGSVYGIMVSGGETGGRISLDQCTIDVTNLGTNSGYCLFVYRRAGSLTVKNCNINGTSNGKLHGVQSITHDFTLTDTNINAAVLTNQKACYAAFYSAVNSDGTAYTHDGIFNVDNCNITATGEGDKGCSAIYSNGTLTVNGGKYFGTREGLAGKHNLSQINDCIFEGCRHGGAYISGSARVQNSIFRITTQRGSLPFDTKGVHYGAMYTGSDVDLYVDGCTFDADEEIDGYTGHGIAVSSNWDNTGGIVYLSNTNFIGNHLSDIRVDRGNVVYLGENVSYRTVLTPNLGDSEKPKGILDKSTYGGIRFMWDKHGNIIDFTEYYEVGKQAEYDRFWDSFQQNGNRANYRFAFAGPCWATKEILIPKYPIKIVDTTTTSRRCMNMFAYFNSGGAKPFDMTELCAKIDFSEASSIQNLFTNAYAENITVDASKAINCSAAFGLGDGGNLNNITLTVSDACTTFTNAFANTRTLTNLTITEGSQIAVSIDLKSCPLTKASIDSVYNALSGTATGKTVSFNKAAVNAAYTADAWNALVDQKSNWTFTLV